MTFAITDQYPIFADTNGTPLENGYIYIGEENENPVTNPISVYWDEDLQYPAGQPVRTLAGAPNRNGSPGQLYCNVSFSILIRDKNNNNILPAYGKNKNSIAESLTKTKNYIIGGKIIPSLLSSGISVDKDRFFIDKTSVYNIFSVQTATLSLFDENVGIINSNTYLNSRCFYYSSAVQSDYARICYIIENITEFAGKTITLSWYDNGRLTFSDDSDVSSKYAVSMTMIDFSGNFTNITGIGRTVLYAATGPYFERKYITTDIPALSDDVSLDDEASFQTGLLINFWISAGDNYNQETNNLGLIKRHTNLKLADVRYNLGSKIIDNNDLTIPAEYYLLQRYMESSISLYGNNLNFIKKNGYITYIAGNAITTIPGFKFRVEKRTNTPTVHAYSWNSGTIDKIYYEGVGDITVSSYNDISSAGVGSMTLAAPTVSGGVYKYHWIADDEFTL